MPNVETPRTTLCTPGPRRRAVPEPISRARVTIPQWPQLREVVARALMPRWIAECVSWCVCFQRVQIPSHVSTQLPAHSPQKCPCAVRSASARRSSTRCCQATSWRLVASWTPSPFPRQWRKRRKSAGEATRTPRTCQKWRCVWTWRSAFRDCGTCHRGLDQLQTLFVLRMQMTPDGGFNSEVNNKLQQVCLCTTCAWQCMSDLSLRRQRLPCIQLDLSVNDIGAGVQQVVQSLIPECSLKWIGLQSNGAKEETLEEARDYAERNLPEINVSV